MWSKIHVTKDHKKEDLPSQNPYHDRQAIVVAHINNNNKNSIEINNVYIEYGTKVILWMNSSLILRQGRKSTMSYVPLFSSEPEDINSKGDILDTIAL